MVSAPAGPSQPHFDPESMRPPQIAPIDAEEAAYIPGRHADPIEARVIGGVASAPVVQGEDIPASVRDLFVPSGGKGPVLNTPYRSAYTPSGGQPFEAGPRLSSRDQRGRDTAYHANHVPDTPQRVNFIDYEKPIRYKRRVVGPHTATYSPVYGKGHTVLGGDEARR